MFTPQSYAIADVPGQPFIDPAEIRRILDSAAEPDTAALERVISRALSLERLSLDDTAVLLNARSGEHTEMILRAARTLKERVYGQRIVIFAPLYVGNRCINDCSYCGFRSSNRHAIRQSLSPEEVAAQVAEMARQGQKRLILVFGEHPYYDPQFIADTTRLVYRTQNDSERINRVNINAAPLSVEGFQAVAGAGIGTYQIFQETYDPEMYARVHGRGPKKDFDFRLTAMDRAMEAGIDDVGLGVLFGLGDWKYEVMALVRHTNHLEACYGVGPHTISFPRIRNASNLDASMVGSVSDDEFRRIVAILRLAVPYAGLILTAREPALLRDELIDYGVSQIDAGTRLEIGGYTRTGEDQSLEREQFELSDTRSLETTVGQLVRAGKIPSFCTACYRKGRTGEHFMQFASSGHIKNYCTPNALLTFAEYLEDYADPELKAEGWKLIARETKAMEPSPLKKSLERKLAGVKQGGRDELL